MLVRCTKIALVKVQELTEIIKTAIEEDVKKKRQLKRPKSTTRYAITAQLLFNFYSVVDYESSAFSTGGIGTSESLNSRETDPFQFHHDSKSVPIAQESIEKNVSPVFDGIYC
jgi:hypothetical protein